MKLRNGFALSFLVSTMVMSGIAGAAHAAETKAKGKPTSPAPSEWSKKMQELYKTLAALLTDVSSDGRFNDPANFQKINAQAKKLASLSHELNQKKMAAPDSDPTLKILAGLFSQEANRAYTSLKRGQRPYARTILQSISGYCITCHTRNQSGPNFKELPLEPASGLVDSFERGEFYAASRQFDRAQAEFSKVLQDTKFASARPLAWERAVRHALNITVRIKQSPSQALEIVNTVIESKSAPYFLKQNAVQWKKSIEEWQAEPQRTAKTEEGLHAEATRLSSKAHDLQKFPMDRSADILYLRASAVAHELLQLAPEGARAADALLLAGVSYEVLSPLRLEDLHEIYYAACIQKSPHTPVAEVCFHRFQESIHSGFTGSSGMEIPVDIKEQLMRLEELARPKELGIHSDH